MTYKVVNTPEADEDLVRLSKNNALEVIGYSCVLRIILCVWSQVKKPFLYSSFGGVLEWLVYPCTTIMSDVCGLVEVCTAA